MTALFFSYGLLLLGNGLFMTLLGLRTKLEGFSTEWVGLLMACYYLGLFIGARYSAVVVERAGHIRAFAAFASFLSMSPLLHVIWIEPKFWLVLRLIDGFSLAGLFMITESWLNARADNNTRGGILALYMVINFMALGLGQLLLPLGNPMDFKLFALASVFFSLSLVPLLLTRASAPLPETPEGMSIKPLLKAAPAGFWGAACAGSVSSAFFSLGPVFAQDLGLSVNQISLFMAAGICGGLVLQIPVGKLSDHVERRKVIASVCLGTLCCALLLGALSLQQASASWLYGAIFAFGSLSSLIYALSVAHANDWCDPDKRMQTSAGLLIGYGCGAVLGPLAGAFVMGQFGPGALFGYIAICCMLMTGYALYQSVTVGQAPEKMEFVPQAGSFQPSEEFLVAAQDSAEPVHEEPPKSSSQAA
ncbi:MFS transporter [Marinobacterium arenosum]|uniref:MFS transporter n=1 Tax=Marinobacterium arenosum TaxID=2862496 RepID=UPI00210612F5|nr:MFS transporter [Marinobacterium arenosum]